MYTPVGIELPEYSEWVRGSAYPKLSPGLPHGRLQIAIGVILYTWGHGRGHVASEVDMNVRVDADDIRRYLPDIEFTSYETLDAAGDDTPEIQKRAYLDEKVRAFLVAGTAVALVVDPDCEEIIVNDAGGQTTRRRGDRFADARFPGLVLDVGDLFDSLVRR